MDTIYTDGQYLANNPQWHTERSDWKAAKIFNLLKKNNIDFTSMGDVGCGAGEVLKCLQTKYDTLKMFYGYEISPQGYRLAAERENERLHFFNSDLFSQPGNVKYDVAMAIDVFEHVEDYFSFLRKIKERGNYKIFHIPLDLSAQSVLRSKPITDRRKKVGHLHYFTKDTALVTLSDLGYRIIDYDYTADTLELPAKSKLSLFAKWPRKIFFSLNKDFTVRLMGGWSLLVLAE